MKHFLYITIYLIITATLYGGETGIIKLTDSSGAEQLNFPSGTALYLYLIDSDQNTDILELETVTINVISDTETAPEIVSLYETGQNTGNFIGSIVFDVVNSASIGDGKLQVQKGDKLTGIYIDPYDDFNNEKTITDISLYGATIQSGTISENTTWSKANSPYLITGDVTVVNTITLTIDPGVEVRFVANADDLASGNYANRSELRIEGILRAIGTIEDSIIFTSNAEVPVVGDWSGIKVLNSSSKALLDYCRIECGDYGLEISGNTNQSDRDTILVENSLFQYGGTALYQSGNSGYNRPIYFNNNTVINADAVSIGYQIFSAEIKNNTITNGRIFCRIYRDTSSEDFLYNNIDISGNNLTFGDNYNNNAIELYLDSENLLNINFNNNTIVGPAYVGIRVFQNSSYYNSKTYVTMMDNRIDNVRHNGIYISNYITSALINNNTIRSSGGSYNNNDNSSNGSGIRIYTNKNCNIEILGNFIEGGNTWGMHLDRTIGRIDSNVVLNNGFGGIYLSGESNYSSSDTLTYNIITGTGYNSDNNSSYSYQGSGVYNTGYSRPVIQYNHFFDNYSYEIYNDTDAELNCKYNFWGAETNAEIAAAPSNPTNLTKIYDSYDNNDKGWVNYGAYKADPILSSPQIPENLSAVENSYPAHLNWSTVTTINLLRYNIYRQDEINDWEYLNSVSTPAGQDTLFRDLTVRENTSYSYRITAESFENTESGFSNEVTITTGVRPIWYISSASGNDYNDGSFTFPFKTIQKAVDTAYGAKDTLLILPGTYLETVHIDENKSLIIGSQFMTDNDTSNVSSTIINGMQAQTGAPIWISDSSAVIKLIGLTLTGGEDHGALITSADSVFLEHVILRDNQSYRGGGIECKNANYISISNSWINNNESDNEGGGIYIGNVDYFEMYNNIISHNHSGDSGWGMGGGLYAFDIENVILKNNTFAFNAGDEHGAVYFSSESYYSGTVWKSDSLLLFNNMFHANSSDNTSNSERDIGGSRNTIVAISNYFDENESDYKHEYERYNSNIFLDRDPFINSSGNNFILLDSSRAINAGTSSVFFGGNNINVPETDYYGNIRPYPVLTNPDIGSVENILGEPMLIPLIVSKDGSSDFTSIQSAIEAAQSYDVVLVMPGDYTENMNFYGKSIVVKSFGGPALTSIYSSSSNSPIVRFHNNETQSAVLDGFTIQGSNYNNGSGISFSSASATIRNCIMTENSGYNYKTIKLYNTSAIFENCLIYNNEAYVFFYEWGEDDISPTIINCTITGNSNVSSDNQWNYIPVFKNCIIYNNSSNVDLGNAAITYSLIEDGWVDIMGNINTDPLFIDPENGDYSLQDTSPCIDAGDPDLDGDGISWEFDPDDQDMDGTRSDMGYSSDYYFCDQCGECDYDALNNCVIDCEGVPGGSAVEDCAGVCNGTAYLDDCDICSGGAMDHIANSDMNVCGVCFAQYDCEPILLNDEDDFTAISLRDSVIIFEFSVSMDTLTFSGITLQSAIFPNIAYHVENDTGSPKKVHLVIESALASRDTLVVDFPSTLRSSFDYGFDGDQDGTAGDALSFTIYTETLADYNHDNQIDINDLSIFTLGWYNKDYKYELGPISGTAPNFIPIFDSTYNIEDMSALMLMWNWANGFATPRMGRYSVVNEPPNFSIKDDILNIDLLPFHDIGTIYIQINTLSPNIHFIEVDNQSTFDLSLLRKWEEENIYEWNFANFSEKGIEEIDICRLQTNITHNQEMLIDYKITSLSGTVLSSGSMNFEYIPVPDEFILQPAYPNPFNPATQLKYGLRENVHVMISIYDILGRQVIQLVSTEQQAGYHEVIWNGNQNASGLYFVKMTAGDYISTQKLMLVK